MDRIGPWGAAVWLNRLGMNQAQLMQDPFPTYHQWQAEHPVWEVEPGQWMVFGYENVRQVLGDAAFIKGEAMPETPPENFAHLPEMPPSMLMSDPPNHTRLRSLVTQAFQPRHLERLRPYVEQLSGELIGDLLSSGGGDLVSQFAFPLPAQVIAELLGVPRSDHEQFREWSQRVARLLDPSQTPEARTNAIQARWELLDYFFRLIETKRRNPKDDLLSELIAAESFGDRLTAGELLAMALLLLVAGHETTTNLLAMGTLALIEHPECDRPRASHPWHDAIEELLRYTSPVQLDARRVADSIQVGSTTLSPGDWVTLVIGSANRDPHVFDQPDHLDLARRPNPHLAFGRGIHFCLGAGLARLEAEVALPALWNTSWTLKGTPLWNENIVLRGLTALPVAPL